MSDERQAEIEAVAYPIFVGVAKAPWTSRDDDEPCPAEPFTKNHARNLARAAIKELDRVRDARGDDEACACGDGDNPVLIMDCPVHGRSPQDEDHETARRAIADAVRALDAALPGEAWAALESAQRSLEAEEA